MAKSACSSICAAVFMEKLIERGLGMREIFVSDAHIRFYG